jgi:hypothetical protein
VDKERVVLQGTTHESRDFVAPVLAEWHHLNAAIRIGLHGSHHGPLASEMKRIIAFLTTCVCDRPLTPSRYVMPKKEKAHEKESEGREPVPVLAVAGWIYGAGVARNVVAGAPRV